MAVGEDATGLTTAIVAAILEANADGGVRGRAIEIVHLPVGDSAIAAAARAATDPRLVAFIGHVQSGPTLDVAPIFVQAGIPVLSPAATSSALAGFTAGVYRFMPDDRTQARFIARQIETLSRDRRRIAILYPNTDYGRPFRSSIETALDPRHDVALILPIVQGAEAETGALVVDARVDLILWLGGDEPLRRLLAHIARAGPLPRVIAGDLTHSPELEETRDPLFSGLYYTTTRREQPNRPDPRWRHSTALLCYDLGRLVVTALREEAPTRDGVRRYLESLGRSRPPFPGNLTDIVLGEDNTIGGGYVMWHIGPDFVHHSVTP